MTKMTDAFKKLFLDLGGNPKELAENNDVGDYILDLESAIKEYVGDKTGDLIDDTEASSTKTYSSTKIESLIPENELPTPASTNVGKVATVVSDGEGGYEWSAENVEAVSFFLANRNIAAHTFKIDSNLAYFGLTFEKLYEFFKSPSTLGFSIKKYGGIFVNKMGFSDNGDFSMENFIPCIGTYEITDNGVTHKSILFHGVIREVDDFGDLKYYTINCILTDSLTGGTYTQTEIT